MDPRPPAGPAARGLAGASAVATALARGALTASPERHPTLRAFSMGGAFAHHPGTPLAHAHARRDRVRAWVEPGTRTDRRRRSWRLLAGRVLR